MTIKQLMDYINENLEDGTLDIDSEVYIKDYDDVLQVNSLYNDCGEFTIASIY